MSLLGREPWKNTGILKFYSQAKEVLVLVS
jgi:hypothetical protein